MHNLFCERGDVISNYAYATFKDFGHLVNPSRVAIIWDMDTTKINDNFYFFRAEPSHYNQSEDTLSSLAGHSPAQRKALLTPVSSPHPHDPAF